MLERSLLMCRILLGPLKELARLSSFRESTHQGTFSATPLLPKDCWVYQTYDQFSQPCKFFLEESTLNFFVLTHSKMPEPYREGSPNNILFFHSQEMWAMGR